LEGIDRSFRREVKPSGRLKIPTDAGSMMKPHRNYVKGRGFTPSLIEEVYQVGGIGVSHRLAWRLFIPIHYRGRMVSWTTRAIGNAQGPRYVSARPSEEAVSHRTLLYGEDLAGHSIVVVEGPIDAWAIGPGAVATMGLACTKDQIEKIAQHPSRAICFDSSEIAQKRARKVADQLKNFPGETDVVELESGEDAAEADPEEIEELRKIYLKETH
jgi:DNA primase